MQDTKYCFVRFKIRSDEQFLRLESVLNALKVAKADQSFPDDSEWLSYFNDTEIATFWRPTQEELTEWTKRWQATPVDQRFNDPSLKTPWDFKSMIEAIRNGEYEIIGVRKEDGIGVLEFNPFAYPFGGTGCLRALILAYQHELVGYDDGAGYIETNEA